MMAPRKLYRSNRERILGGVAGGMAEHFDLDPTLIRLIWVVAVIAGGFGLLAYIIAWIVIPESPEREVRAAHIHEEDEEGHRSSESGYWVMGLILIGLGVFLLLRNFVPWFRLGEFWPVLIILMGVLMLAGASRSRTEKGE